MVYTCVLKYCYYASSFRKNPFLQIIIRSGKMSTGVNYIELTDGHRIVKKKGRIGLCDVVKYSL